MATEVKRNGRLQEWDLIVHNLRALGLVGDEFRGQITLHFLDGRPTRYERREVGQLDTRERHTLDCRNT